MDWGSSSLQALPTSVPASVPTPSVPSLQVVVNLAVSLPTPVYVAIAVVMLPIVIVFGSVLVKILWGFWALPLSLLLTGMAIWHLGIDWFWLIAIGIIVGVLATWLWQRTRLFLAGDRLLERVMFLGD